MQSAQYIAIHHKDTLATITLLRAEKANALSQSMSEQLIAALNDITAPDCRGILIKANGTFFCAGHDASELIHTSETQVREVFDASKLLIQTIRKHPLPICAVMHGGAIGAGAMLALACDFIVASHTAYFQTAGGAKGWFCFTPAAILMDKIPEKRLKEMLFGGAQMTAQEALSLNLINKIAPTDTIQESAEEFLKAMTQGDPHMLSLGKNFLHDTENDIFNMRLKDATRLMQQTCLMNSAQDRLKSIKAR